MAETRRHRLELVLRLEVVTHDGAPLDETARRVEGELRSHLRTLPGRLRFEGGRLEGYPGVEVVVPPARIAVLKPAPRPRRRRWDIDHENDPSEKESG